MPLKKKARRSRKRMEFKKFSGVVLVEPVYVGSKSERLAVKLDTGSTKLLLRRLGTRSYRDETLEALAGKTITCDGIKRGGRLYLRKYELD